MGFEMTEAWAYYDTNTIQISGDVSAYYWPNQLVSITQTTQKFFVVMGVSVVGGNTHLTISGGGIYVLANAPITAHAVTANAGISGLPSGFLAQGLAYGAASKDAPVDGDRLTLWDSAANFVQKGLTWANLKAALKTHFDTQYAPKARSYNIEFSLDGGGSAITTGHKAGGDIPLAGTITSVRVISTDNTSGSISITVNKGTLANTPGSMSAMGTFAISSSTKNVTTGLSIVVAAGDCFELNVTSVTSLKNVLLSMTVEVA